MGPIDDETKPLLSKLLCLHEYGFLTLQSQPSSSELHEGTNSQCANCMGFTSSRQRAFLTFMLPRGECPGEPLEAQSVKRCLDELVKDKHFYTSIASTQGACKRGSCPKELVIKSTFPEDWETHRYKTVRFAHVKTMHMKLISSQAATEPELELAEEKTRKAFEHDCTCTLEGLKSSGATFERMNPYLIHVLAKEWKQVDLPGLVGAAADRAGMGPVYSEMLDYGSDSMRDSDEGNTDGNVD